MSTQDSPVETKSPAQLSLELVVNSCYGSLSQTFERLWGTYGSRGRGLVLDPSAAVRVGQVFGTIAGLVQSGNPNPFARELAQRMAHDFVNRLDYLANYGFHNNGEEEKKKGIPFTIIKLYDDGNLNDFSIVFYHRIDWRAFCKEHQFHTLHETDKAVMLDKHRIAKEIYYGQNEAVVRPKGVLFPDPQYAYAFAGNGGLSYRGPGRGQQFSVDLGDAKDCLWGIHT